MAQVIHDHPNVGACLVKSLYRYANGHTETDGEEDTLEYLSQGFALWEYRVQELLIELVKSPSFLKVGEVK